jgi:hypothetical protein
MDCAACHGRTDKDRLIDFVTMLLALTIPVIWVEVARGHSLIHAGFASRGLAMSGVVPFNPADAVPIR